MKTFKVAEISFLLNDQVVQIPLQDGLIINQEDGTSAWLIELFLHKEDQQILQLFQEADRFTARVTITHRHNEPAFFHVRIREIHLLDRGVSVLLDARLSYGRADYPKQILQSLLGKGLSDEELLRQFTEALSNHSQTQ